MRGLFWISLINIYNLIKMSSDDTNYRKVLTEEEFEVVIKE
ncbi:hypothetical protein bcere0009_43230 [Bacillus cereus R309803]|nr:hypothetical protein bcere0009_43230 [Bacillus cereus R309803]